MTNAERQRRWRARNPEKAKEVDRARYIDEATGMPRRYSYDRTWAARNPAFHGARVRRYQARRKDALCACCAPISFKFIYLQARGLKMEVDHVHPLSKGGKHCLRNLQLLDRSANRAKGAIWRS